MSPDSVRFAARFAVPQLFTAVRIVIGVWALFAAVLHQPDLAVKLLTIGVITDALDGMFARLLRVESPFGYLFDLFSDYLYYIVVPGLLTLFLAESGLDTFAVLILGLPFLAGALRYARIFNMSLSESFAVRGTPGLGTNIYAFYVVALVLLKRDGALTAPALHQILLFTVPVFSLLMIAPVRYPKLAKYNAVLIPLVAGLNIMPFFHTVPLAWLTLILGSIYVVFSPLLVSQRQAARSLR